MKDPKYGYIPSPEGNGFMCAAELNSDNYRDEEFYPKKKGEFLILVVGDSWVYGQGLRKKDRFTEILEKKLDKIRKTQVFNLGECGSNIYKNFLTAEKYRLKLNPDLTVFSFNDNDLLVHDDLSDIPPQSVIPKNKELVFDITAAEEKQTYVDRVLGTYDIRSANREVLFSIVPDLPKDKTLYLFVAFDLPAQIANAYKEVEKIFFESGLKVIDNHNLYQDRYKKLFSQRKYGPFISSKEGHPNALVNQMLAERLYLELTQNTDLGFNE